MGSDRPASRASLPVRSPLPLPSRLQDPPQSRWALGWELPRGCGWAPSTQSPALPGLGDAPGNPQGCRLAASRGRASLCGGGLLLWARGAEPTGPCSDCGAHTGCRLLSGPQPGHLPTLSVGTVSPTLLLCVCSVSCGLSLEDQVPGFFICFSFPGLLKGKRFSSPRPHRVGGVRGWGWADSSCRDQAGLASGSWEERSARQPLCVPALSSPV